MGKNGGAVRTRGRSLEIITSNFVHSPRAAVEIIERFLVQIIQVKRYIKAEMLANCRSVIKRTTYLVRFIVEKQWK